MQEHEPRLARMHYGAGYRLNDEVRQPTQALLRASQIGVLVHDTPELKDVGNKDALLVVSYGTSQREAREAAIEPVVDDIAAENPEADIFQAYTSGFMRQKAKERDDLDMPSPGEALELLLENGYTRVAVASLNFFPGLEYEALIEVFNACRSRFKRLVLGVPLLYWMAQEEQRDDFADFLGALREGFPLLGDDEATLLMAHGTKHPSNSFYTALQTRFHDSDWKNAFVYTMIGWPRIEHIIPHLRDAHIRRVILVPLMLGVGTHVLRDMMGSAPTSHRALLEAAGFEVNVRARGLGELPAVRSLYVDRANEAWDTLKQA